VPLSSMNAISFMPRSVGSSTRSFEGLWRARISAPAKRSRKLQRRGMNATQGPSVLRWGELCQNDPPCVAGLSRSRGFSESMRKPCCRIPPHRRCSAVVPRTRSSHSHAASPIANFGFKRALESWACWCPSNPKFARCGAARFGELRIRDTSPKHLFARAIALGLFG
jgi:hypothetical protein